MKLSNEEKREIARNEMWPSFVNNWTRYEGNSRAWAEANLMDAPFVEPGDDILAPKDIIIQ